INFTSSLFAILHHYNSNLQQKFLNIRYDNEKMVLIISKL
ncbi:hypothetical protein LCGC14_0636900, partial [marine sediment metagenome]